MGENGVTYVTTRFTCSASLNKGNPVLSVESAIGRKADFQYSGS